MNAQKISVHYFLHGEFYAKNLDMLKEVYYDF